MVGSYTIGQVLAEERRAWASAGATAEPDYYFDGIMFWQIRLDGSSIAAPPEEVPAEGWWHGDGCNCTLCRRSAE